LRWRLHRIRRLWPRRELQHGPLLARTEMREQHDLSVGNSRGVIAKRTDLDQAEQETGLREELIDCHAKRKPVQHADVVVNIINE
jgi:hypothetical protein